MDEPITAALVDLDGTLVDTNYGHVVAWARAFRQHDVDVTMARLHGLVGMGSDQLIAEIAGEERPDVEDAWSEEFEPFLHEAVALPGARELLRALHERSIRVVLATSGQPKDVEHLLGVLDADQWIHEVVSSEEVDASKPDPAIFHLARQRAGSDVDRTVVIGDTVWDVQAATRAQLPCVAVATGGIDPARLHAAGAAQVHDDAAALAERLDHLPFGERVWEG